MKIFRTIALLAFASIAAASAHAQQADWDIQIGNANGTISIQIGPAVRYKVTYSRQLGGTTQTFDPVEGNNVSFSKAIGPGRLHISVRAYDASGRPVVPIHIIGCGGGVVRFSMSQPGAGNPCANWNEATVTVISN